LLGTAVRKKPPSGGGTPIDGLLELPPQAVNVGTIDTSKIA
jgi:hypothetical protein